MNEVMTKELYHHSECSSLLESSGCSISLALQLTYIYSSMILLYYASEAYTYVLYTYNTCCPLS
jgi:hypothetical protein